MKKMRAQHFEALLAWEGFEALQNGGIQEQIIHQASLVYAREKQTCCKKMKEETPYSAITEQTALESTAASQESEATTLPVATWPMAPVFLCTPVYVNCFDVYGQFLGCFVQGYQMSQAMQPVPTIDRQQDTSLTTLDTSDASPASPDSPAAPDAPASPDSADTEDDLVSESSYFSELLWELPRRHAVRLHQQRKAPTVLHLGKKQFHGQTYGLDLVTLLSASTSEALHFHASLKLLDAPESGEAYLVCFGKENLPVYHDFSTCQVCVSPPLAVSLETLSDPLGTLTLSVTILSLY